MKPLTDASGAVTVRYKGLVENPDFKCSSESTSGSGNTFT